MHARSSLALLIAGWLLACSAGGPSLVTRTYALKYLRGQNAAPIIAPYVYTDRQNAKGMFTVSDNAITVRETPDNLDKIARVLAEYDRPRPFVRLAFHLIEADGAATTDSAIRDVEATLRQLFRFRGYRLVAEGVASVTEKGEVTQTLTTAPRGSYEATHGGYELNSSVERLAGSGDSATVELSVHLQGAGSSFRTTVTIPVGKTAVLGNVQPLPSGRTLILTVRPELLTTSPVGDAPTKPR
jgi:hypothetical protein